MADVPFALHVNNWKEATECLPSYAAFHIPTHQAQEMQLDYAFHMNVDLQDVGIDDDDHSILRFHASDLDHEIFMTSQGGYKFKVQLEDGSTAAIGECDATHTRYEVRTFGNTRSRSCGLNNIIMMAFAYAAAHFGVLLVHASVVFRHGKAHLFLGPSGTGKSTHSSLWLKHISDTDLLNDDNPAVRVDEEGNVTAYGTPWSGKTPCYRNLQFPVGSIVRLHQAPANSIRRLNGLEAFSAFYPSCSLIVWDEVNRSEVIAHTEAVACHAPIYALDCLPDEEAARLCCTTVEGGAQ